MAAHQTMGSLLRKAGMPPRCLLCSMPPSVSDLVLLRGTSRRFSFFLGTFSSDACFSMAAFLGRLLRGRLLLLLGRLLLLLAAQTSVRLSERLAQQT